MKTLSKHLIILAFSLLFVSVSISQTYPQSTWSVLPDLPFTQRNHVTTGWKNGDTNFIITAGGRIDNAVSNRVLLYNTISQDYRELAPMPEAIEKGGGFVLGDSLFLVGGSKGLLGLLTKKVYKLDLITNIWTQRNNFPISIGEITQSTVAFNNRYAYVTSGFNGLLALNTVYLYDVYYDSWQQATLLPTIGLFNSSVSVLNDSTLFIAGGRTLGNLLSNTFIGRVNKNNPLSILWSAGPSFPGGVIFNVGSWGNRKGRVFFTGGSRSLFGDASSSDASGQTYMYSEENGEYDTLSDKPTPITHTQIYGYDSYGGGISHNEIYVPGGSTASGSGTDAHEVLIVEDTVKSSVGIQTINNTVPKGFALSQNYPNPFNPSTSINFAIPNTGSVKLALYDFLGREMAVLVNDRLAAGIYKYNFIAAGYTAGVYFYRLTAEGYTETRKMILLK